MNDQTAKASVTHENVRTPAEQEVWYREVAGGLNRERQLIGGVRAIQEIGRSADAECGHGAQSHIALDTVRVERFREGSFAVDRERHGIPGHWGGVDTGLNWVWTCWRKLEREANIALAFVAW